MRQSLAAALAAFAALSGCGRAHSEDAGATVSRNYQVGNFQKIEVAGPYDVNVRTGSSPSVSAQGSQNLLDHATVEVDGDKLLIRPKHSGSWFHGGWSNNGHATFTITVPQLNEATLAGAGDMRVDHVQGETFEGNLAGAGGLQIDSVAVQALKLSIAGAGDAKLGGGKVQTASYSIAGAGDVDTRQVAAVQAKVSIMGSGSVRGQASGTADVTIMGAGDVELTGGGKCSVHKMGSGDVRCS